MAYYDDDRYSYEADKAFEYQEEEFGYDDDDYYDDDDDMCYQMDMSEADELNRIIRRYYG